MDSPPKPQRLAELHYERDALGCEESQRLEDASCGKRSLGQSHLLQLPMKSTVLSDRQQCRELLLPVMGTSKRHTMTTMHGCDQTSNSSVTEMQSVDANTTQFLPFESKAVKTEESSEGDIDLDIQSAIVEDILEKRLPLMVNEVSKSERGYSDELATLEHQVLQAASHLKSVEDQLKRITEEVRSYTRQIYVSDDDIIKSKREILNLEKVINQMTHEKVQSEHSISEQEHELKLQEEKFSRYRNSMSSYKTAVNVAEEASSQIYKDVKTHREKIASLEASLSDTGSEEVEKLLDGTTEKALKADIESLEAEDNDLEASCTDLLLQIEAERDKQRLLTQDTEVLHKRNAALLRRLKRQLRNFTK